jgi:uncharacterized protein
MLLLFLLIVGGFCGTVASILGVGSSMMMAPLLLYIFPFMAGVHLDIQTVNSITLVLTLFSTSAATIRYHRLGLIPYRYAFKLGTFGSIGSFIGGSYISQFVNHLFILILLGVVAVLSFIFNLIPRREQEEENKNNYHSTLGVIIIFILGMITGVIGIGGMALLIPFMIHVLGFPIRKIIGTTTFVGAMIALFGIIGKSTIGLMMWKVSMVVAVGGLIGGYVGPSLAKYFPERFLRYGMNLILLTIIITVWLDISKFVSP